MLTFSCYIKTSVQDISVNLNYVSIPIKYKIRFYKDIFLLYSTSI